MRYLVRARVKPGQEGAVLRAIETGALGRGSVAEGEYLRACESCDCTDRLEERVARKGQSFLDWLRRAAGKGSSHAHS